MSMSLATMRAQVRRRTSHDADLQVEDAADIDVAIDGEYKRLRRLLINTAPRLYLITEGSFTLSGSSDTHALPSDFERVWRFERQEAGRWFPVPVATEPDASQPVFSGRRSFRVEAANLIVSPVALAPGTYRLTYHPGIVAGYTTVTVPDGLEEIIINRAAALLMPREMGDVAEFTRIADRVWAEQRPALRRAYGAHPVSGLRVVRGY